MNNTKLKLCFILALALAFSLPAISQVQSEELHDTLWTKDYHTTINYAMFHPNGKEILIAGRNFFPAQRLDLNGNVIMEYPKITETKGFSLSPDGKIIASTKYDDFQNDTTVCLWDYETGNLIKELRIPKLKYGGPIHCGVWYLTFTPDGKYLVGLEGSCTSQPFDFHICYWDLSTYEVKTSDVTFNGTSKLIISPNNEYFAFYNYNVPKPFPHGIRIMKIGSWEYYTDINFNNLEVTSMAFSNDGKYLYYGLVDGTIRKWDTEKKIEIDTINLGITNSIAISPNNKYLVKGCSILDENNSTYVWDINNKKVIYEYIYPQPSAYFLDVSPDAKYIISGCSTISLYYARWEPNSVNEDIRKIDILSVNPNPTNSSIIINYNIINTALVTLDIVDSNGNIIETLIKKKQDTGDYVFEWNTNNIPNGIYFCRLLQDNKVDTIKIVINK